MKWRIAAAICAGALGLEAQGIHLALAGDAILNRRLSVFKDPAYLAMFEMIRGSDAGFTNFETLIDNYEFPGAAASGGAYQTSPPWIVDEFKWAGFKLLSVANNHTFDYGVEGMRSTLRALDAAGLTHAGAGENLAFARAPAYLDTGHGRIALIACASTFTEGSPAGEQRPDLKGRPGLSPLRFSTTYTVDAATLEGLRRLALLSAPGAGRGGAVRIAGATYTAGDQPAIHTAPLKDDVDGITASIRDARRQSDWVMVSIHAHEGVPGHREQPAEFLVAFAHAAIDAGADLFVAHGPHVLRAIEIYKGKPIFYSLANFAFENETMQFQPEESYKSVGLGLTATPADYFDARSNHDTRGFPVDKPIWESVIAEVSFDAERSPSRIVLHPITLGFGEPRAQRGRPRPASPEDARRIVDNLAKLSASFGTKIDVQAGLGVVELNRKKEVQ